MSKRCLRAVSCAKEPPWKTPFHLPPSLPPPRQRSPADVSRWMSALPPAADVVVYCVHGHQVSQGVAQALREAGWKARFLDHGLEGWREAGGPVVPRPA